LLDLHRFEDEIRCVTAHFDWEAGWVDVGQPSQNMDVCGEIHAFV